MNKREQVLTYLKQQSGLFGRELFLKDLGSFNNNLYSNTENKESSKGRKKTIKNSPKTISRNLI